MKRLGIVFGLGLVGVPRAGLTEDLMARKVALLQWFPQDFSVAAAPGQIAFDREHVWISNTADGRVTKLRAIDGVVVGMAFDGEHIWVANMNDNTVMKLRSDG